MHLQCLVSMSSTHLLFHSWVARKVSTWLTYQLWITITETNQVLAFQLGLLRSLANSVKCFCLQVALTLSPTNTITPQKNWHWQTFHAQKFLVTLNLCFFGHFSRKKKYSDVRFEMIYIIIHCKGIFRLWLFHNWIQGCPIKVNYKILDTLHLKK